jgi:hypothetical protein
VFSKKRIKTPTSVNPNVSPAILDCSVKLDGLCFLHGRVFAQSNCRFGSALLDARPYNMGVSITIIGHRCDSLQLYHEHYHPGSRVEAVC